MSSLTAEELRERSQALHEANYIPDVDQITAIVLYHGDGDKVVLSPDDPWTHPLFPALSKLLATYKEELTHRALHGPQALALEVIANIGPDASRQLVPLGELWVVADASGTPLDVNGVLIAYDDARLAALVARSGLVRTLAGSIGEPDAV